jgi:hypothetical protein
MANNFAEAFFGGINDARQSRAQQEQAGQSRLMNTMRIEDAQQQRQVSQQQALYGLAKGYKDYLAQNPQGGAMYYERFLKPSLAGLGLGDAGPYNEPEAVALADQVLSAYGGGATGESYTLAPGSKRFDANNQLVAEVPFSPANAQLVNVPDGRGGTVQMLLDPRTQRFTQPNYGQPSAPQIPAGGMFTGPDGMPTRIDPNLPAEVQQAIMADPNAWATAPSGSSTQLPDRQGGALGYTPPKPENAPSGYRYGANGTLEPIPGGPADKQNNPVAADLAKGERDLRRETQDRIKQDRSVLNMFTNVQNAARSGSAAGDLSLIFAFMKMLDPGSVVREQEFANAQNAAGIPDRILNYRNQILRGERLNPSQREQFMNEARQLAGAAQDRITAVTREQQNIAQEYGYDPTRATGMADFRGVNQSPSQAGPARPTTDAEYNALPSGAEFIDPDDGQTYRKP